MFRTLRRPSGQLLRHRQSYAGPAMLSASRFHLISFQNNRLHHITRVDELSGSPVKPSSTEGQTQSGTGSTGAVPQSVSFKDWGLWIWSDFCTGDESMSPGVNVLGGVPCASCRGSGSSTRFDVAASMADCCGSSLAQSQVQFNQGCRHGCHRATNRPHGSSSTSLSWRSLSCSSLQWYCGDRTDRLGPRVIRSRQSFEYRGRLEEHSDPDGLCSLATGQVRVLRVCSATEF